jgi:hypothetical protein
MSTLYEIIKSLQTTQGNNAKQAILDANKDNELLREYFKAMLDPAINYYITKLPKQKGDAMTTMDIELINWFITNIAGRVFTGKTAEARIKGVMSCLDEEGIELLSYIIKRKIAGANVGETMVLKTWPGLFFIPPYMRCSLMTDKIRKYFDSLEDIIVQKKADGSFLYLMKRANELPKAFTRNGSMYPQWMATSLAEGLPEDINVVLAGELLVYPSGQCQAFPLSRKVGNGVLNSILQGEDVGEFDKYIFCMEAWDAIPVLDFEEGVCKVKYAHRLDQLLKFADNCPNIGAIESHVVHNLEEAYKIYSSYTAQGLEGAVIKDPSAEWRDHTSPFNVKLKIEFECEMKITGYYEGEGKAKGMLGGYTVASSDDKIVTNVGSGLSDQQRNAAWDNIMHAEGHVGDIVTIKANDIISKEGSDVESLFLPIFIEHRYDKKEADSSERIHAQLEAAKNGGMK